MAVTTETTEKKLQVLDPDLPFIASEAAVELDNFIAGRSDDLDSVELLGSILRNSFTISSKKPYQKSLMDPVTMTIYKEAEDKSKDVLSSLLKGGRLISDLLCVKELKTLNPQFLEILKKFCIALSNAFLSYSESSIDVYSNELGW